MAKSKRNIETDILHNDVCCDIEPWHKTADRIKKELDGKY